MKMLSLLLCIDWSIIDSGITAQIQGIISVKTRSG